MDILVINSGSSSLKYQLINPETKEVKAKGLVERIGIGGSRVKHSKFSDSKEIKKTIEQDIPDHEVGMKIVADLLTDLEVGVIHNPDEIKAVGHRIVHGGEKLFKPTLVTDSVVKELEAVTPISSVHNPGHLAGIKVGRKIFNKAEHVLVFDTAFHQTMPPKAFRYAIPKEYYTEHHIRAYGFHGTSHKFVYNAAKKYLNNDKLKAITIHLGNGASMAAVNEKGEVMDTTMGLTPLDGLVMGTRCGSIDASVAFFMGEVLGKSISEIKNIFNQQSGFLGLAGSSDARDVEEKYLAGDADAILCYEMDAYRIQKFIGAYSVVLNGADALVFTAGLGENDALLRSLACKNLEFLGIKLDENKNKELNHPKAPVEIQAEDSKIKILIIPTNEELQIAKEVNQLIKE